MAKSPQVVLTSKSSGAYAVTTSDTVLAVVGYATKGPLNKVSTVTSKSEFIEKFGPTSKVAPWSNLAVSRAFNQGNKILFYRIEDGTATNAEVAILNKVDAANAYQEFSATVDNSSYVSERIYSFKVTVDVGGVQRDVFITSPETGDWLLSSIAASINNQLGNTAGFNEFANVLPNTITNGDYVLNIDIDGGGANDVTVTLADTDTLSDIATKLNAVLTGATASVNSITDKIRIYSDSTGSSSTIAIGTPGAGTDLTSIIGTVEVVADGEDTTNASCSVNSETKKIRITSGNATTTNSSVNISAGSVSNTIDLVSLLGTDAPVAYVVAVPESSTDNILFISKEKGSSCNDISVVKTSRTNPLDSSTINKVDIYYGENLKESFDNVSLDPASTEFFVTKINADPSNGGSEWITVEYEKNSGSTDVVFSDGTYKLGTGTDEFTTGDEIGDYDYKVGTDGIPSDPGTSNSSAFVLALGTDGDLANMEAYDFHILITPDNGSEVVQAAAIALAEYRKDFMYIADPPKSLTYLQVADWHNGLGNHGRSNALNSKFAATAWGWLKDYDATNGEYVWAPPSVFLAEKWMEVDKNNGPWAVAAGDKRGKINAFDYEASPSLAQREVLYGDFNAVNPIVFFNNKGLELYGEKTLLRENVAENRIHVERMAIYVKKLIKLAMSGMIFEANNTTSWSQATNLINTILENVRQKGGLDDYKVIINETTTTQSMMEQNIMKGIIELVPVGSIEIVKLDIIMNNPGATIQ